MKTKKIRIRQGFTIVELVIVIGVVGVLAAVLIPTFINLNSKANQAADESLIKNLNTQLRMKEVDEGKNKTMTEALADALEAGYKVENLTPKSGKDIVWNQEKDEFFQLDSVPADGYKYWTIAKSNADLSKGYSVYLNYEISEITTTVGVDVGTQFGVTIHYGKGATPKTDVRMRTNGGTLEINADTDTVKHYGDGNVLDVKAIAGASYHEFGYFPKASIAEGRIVVEEGGNIPSVEISAVPTSEKPISIETNQDIVVFASEDVVAELDEGKLDNVSVAVTNDKASVTVDEKVKTTNVTVNGKTATEEDVISITKVASFEGLSAALSEKDAYIMLTDDADYPTNGSGLLNIDYNVTIDGNGNAINGYGNRSGNNTTIAVNNGGTQMVDVKLVNLTMNNGGAAGRPIETRGNIRSITLENVVINATGTGNNQAITIGGNQATATKITLLGSTINANRAGYPIISFNPIDVEIKNSYFDGYCGIYFKGKNSSAGSRGSKVVAEDTVFNSPNSYDIEGDNSFGVFAFEDNEIDVTIKGCKVNISQSGSAYQALGSFKKGYACKITIDGDSYINGLLSLNGPKFDGEYKDYSSSIILNGGTFTVDPLSEDGRKGGSVITELGKGKSISATSNFTWVVK